MASGFQRAKVRAMFEVFDADGNGLLEEADFAALVERWRLLPRVAAAPELTERVRGGLMGWWHHLSALAAEEGRARGRSTWTS